MKWMLGIIATCFSLCVSALADDAAELQIVKGKAAHLQSLVREHAAGMAFESIESKTGKVFQEVVIRSVSKSDVSFNHKAGKDRLAAAECPQLWVDLFGFAKSEGAAALSKEFKKPGAEIAQAIVVIEGDASTGTGFFCRSEGKVYLYTAAHVLSGNTRLKVKLRDGTVVRKFGTLQAAEGADMVRLPVEEDVPSVLQIAPESGIAAVGMPVYASGNAGGGGTVGYEEGGINGVGPESIEIDAEVIQGNSGGPILHGNTHLAMGVVTHLTAARKDLWAEETRYADVRRFGCRLDRHWEWKSLPVDMFLKEGKEIAEIREQSELMIAALQPEKWGDAVFQTQRDNPLARDITALNKWIDQQRRGGQRFSETDRKKRLRGIFESGRHRSRAQMDAFDSSHFTWYHRETAAQEIKTRDEIDEAYDSTAQDLR